MGRDGDDQIQIAAGVGAAAALARHSHALAGPHPGGDLHLELPLGALPAAAVARRARFTVDVARAVAGGAGLLALEAEALARAVEGFVERDLDAGLDVVASAPSPARAAAEQVFQSLEIDGLPSAAASARAGAEIAEDRPEEVGEASGFLRIAVLDVEAAGRSRARLTRGPLSVALPVRAEAVVPPALVRVRQHLVGLVDFLELLGRARDLGHVRMVLARELPVRRLDRLVVSAPVDTEDAVIVLEFHSHMCERAARGPT